MAREVQERLENIKFPLEHHPQVIGVFAERQAAQRRLAGYAILAVSGIFLILLSVLKRVRLAVLAVRGRFRQANGCGHGDGPQLPV